MFVVQALFLVLEAVVHVAVVAAKVGSECAAGAIVVRAAACQEMLQPDREAVGWCWSESAAAVELVLAA